MHRAESPAGMAPGSGDQRQRAGGSQSDAIETGWGGARRQWRAAEVRHRATDVRELAAPKRVATQQGGSRPGGRPTRAQASEDAAGRELQAWGPRRSEGRPGHRPRARAARLDPRARAPPGEHGHGREAAFSAADALAHVHVVARRRDPARPAGEPDASLRRGPQRRGRRDRSDPSRRGARAHRRLSANGAS